MLDGGRDPFALSLPDAWRRCGETCRPSVIVGGAHRIVRRLLLGGLRVVHVAVSGAGARGVCAVGCLDDVGGHA